MLVLNLKDMSKIFFFATFCTNLCLFLREGGIYFDIQCMMHDASFIMHDGCLGEASLKKTGKFGKNSQLGLTPPPPSDNSELFEFQKLLKNSDPPPLGPNSEMFEIQNISMAADPLG